MSQNQRETASLDRLFAARIMGLGVVVSVSICIVMSSISVWPVAGMVVLTTLLIARRMYSCVVFTLILCLGQRLAVAWSFGIWQWGLVPSDIVLAIGVLGFMATSMKYINLDPRRFRWQGRANGEVSQNDPAHAAIHHPLSSTLLRLPVAAALAWGILAVLSQDVFRPNHFRFDPAVLRMVAVMWTLAVFVGIPSSVLSLIRWRSLQTAQAEIYLRGELAREIRREQKQVERALSRNQNKPTKTRLSEDVADHS